MPTPSEYAINREKLRAGTGPTSDDGKAISSQNARTHGLSATRITPDQELAYERHGNALLDCLTPANPIEDACAREIIRATWRLNRCAETEETNEDPDIQKSVDRARAQALNAFLKSTAELRRLQTNRRIAIELYSDGTDLTKQGIAAQKEIVSAIARDLRRRVIAQKLPIVAPEENRVAPADPTDSSFCNSPETAENTAPTTITKQTPPGAPMPITKQTPTPRNALCPCQSGQKFKRCCGRNAPPVLFPQRRKAA